MKLGRNDPCWCQSGKKYKRCHLGRDSLPRPKAHEVFAPLDKAFKRKTCWHRGVDGTDCGRIVHAHTVPRAMSLKRIAEDGHVIGLLRKRPGPGVSAPYAIGRVGIAGASTMLGFCREHDSRVFAPLETQPFTGSPEQLWLLHYRALCRELYGKSSVLQGLPAALDMADRGLPLIQQMMLQANVGGFIEGARGGLEVLERHKSLFDADYQARDWSRIHGLVLWFDAVPPLMCSSLVAPDFDFEGNPLPDSSGTELEDDAVTFDVVGAGGTGAAVLTWRTESKLPGEALARTLTGLRVGEMGDAIVRLAIEGTENWFGRPSWWSGLSASARKDLAERVLCGSPAKEHGPQCLALRTETYSMPEVTSVERVNWVG